MPIPSLTTSLKKRVPGSSVKAVPSTKTARDPPPDGAADHGAQPTYASRPTSSHSVTGDGAKKRSFLPQPGELRYATRRVDTGRMNTTATPNAPEEPKIGRPRPRSMYQTSTAAQLEEAHSTEGAPARHVRLPSVVDRSAAAQPASALRRAPSFRRPTAPTTAAQPPPSPRGHLRTQSSSTALGASAEPRAQKERPKSLFVSRSASVKAPERSPVDTTSSSARLAALRRSASVRAKPEAPGSTHRPGAPAQAQATSARPREPTKEEPKKSRPAFSTLQQHFTPRKVGKALTSTFLHPAAPDPGANAISAETASVQAELMQLHLLHQASAETTRQWELSAHRSLQRQFEEVKSLHQILRDEERQGQEQKNIRALRDWSIGSASCGFAEHVQILSGPLQELPMLLDSGGRFQRLVGDFQKWISWVEEIWAARESNAQNSSSLESAEALGDSWKAENAALTRKLTSFTRDLSRLTQPAPGSSIACVVTACQQLVDGMLEELYTMQKIENDVVAREKDWVEASLQAIARDVGAHLGHADGDEAWRS